MTVLKELATVYFSILSRNFPGVAEENHRSPHPEYRAQIQADLLTVTYRGRHALLYVSGHTKSLSSCLDIPVGQTQSLHTKKSLCTVQPKFFIRHRTVSITPCSRWFCNGDKYTPGSIECPQHSHLLSVSCCLCTVQQGCVT
jgi:hypothetical protein